MSVSNRTARFLLVFGLTRPIFGPLCCVVPDVFVLVESFVVQVVRGGSGRRITSQARRFGAILFRLVYTSIFFVDGVDLSDQIEIRLDLFVFGLDSRVDGVIDGPLMRIGGVLTPVKFVLSVDLLHPLLLVLAGTHSHQIAFLRRLSLLFRGGRAGSAGIRLHVVPLLGTDFALTLIVDAGWGLRLRVLQHWRSFVQLSGFVARARG